MAEFEGRTIEEAIETGLNSLALSRDEAEIEVVEEGRGGVFGLGAKLALVRITPRKAASAAAKDSPNPIVKPAAQPDPESQPQSDPEQPEAVVSPMVEKQAQMAEPEMAEVEPVSDPDPVDMSEEDLVLAICQDFLQNVLDRMGLTTEVQASTETSDDGELTYLLNIEGEDLGILIGRRAETLESIQYLVRLVANRHTHRWPRIEVDVEHYKKRREQSLQRLAVNMADRAVRDGRTVTLEAMHPRERRLVHLALRDRDDVYTESVGEGDNRKVTIVPAG